MKVFLAMSHDYIPVAVFAHLEDAISFGDACHDVAEVVEYDLFYGQPPICGFNSYTVRKEY